MMVLHGLGMVIGFCLQLLFPIIAQIMPVKYQMHGLSRNHDRKLAQQLKQASLGAPCAPFIISLLFHFCPPECCCHTCPSKILEMLLHFFKTKSMPT